MHRPKLDFGLLKRKVATASSSKARAVKLNNDRHLHTEPFEHLRVTSFIIPIESGRSSP